MCDRVSDCVAEGGRGRLINWLVGIKLAARGI